MPTLYIFYNSIILNQSTSILNKGLQINSNGLKGGKGGRGGKGGNGGQGARGTDGESTLLEPCKAGPGVGSSGGNAGSGGKGGKAGKGGDAMNIFLLGPNNFSEYFTIKQTGASPGLPGDAGYDGIPGTKGGFGNKPSACLTYPYVSQLIHDGYLIPNPAKSIGESNIMGKDGQTIYSDNYNLFNPYDKIISGEFKNGKYITPKELENNSGFKKIIQFDFENILTQLNEFTSFGSLPFEQRESFQTFKYQLEAIIKSVNKQGLNKGGNSFILSVQRVLPVGNKFYNNDFFIINAELNLGNETIIETFESYFSIVDKSKLSISNYSKFLFNSEHYSMEKNILGHRLEKELKEKLKY